MDIIDTEDHASPVNAASMKITPGEEATLEQLSMERQLAVLPRIAVLDKSRGSWTSLEEAILDSLMDCTYYKVLHVLL